MTTWQEVRDKLEEWKKNPDQFKEDAFEAPTENVLNRADAATRILEEFNIIPPERLVIGSNGEIIMTMKDKDVEANLYVWKDGVVELRAYHSICITLEDGSEVELEPDSKDKIPIITILTPAVEQYIEKCKILRDAGLN